MLLYIHVPFCQSKCAYCAFYSCATASLSVDVQLSITNSYCTALLQELRFRAPVCKNKTVTSIFFGGGTPSLLRVEQIQNILSTVKDLFQVAKNAEISIEANPESATIDWLQGVRSLGVTRLSFGVQSFTDTDLQLLGRVHTAAQATLVLQAAKKLNFPSISLDLMWGLPQQGKKPNHIQHWLETLTTALACQPNHISTYALSFEENTPLTQMQKSAFSFPTEDEECAMYLLGIELLQQHGFAQYEISNFAQTDHQCQHNLGYWTGKDYLGVGPSAVSTLGSTRWTNIANSTKWLHLLPQHVSKKSPLGTLELHPFYTTENLSQQDKLHELLLLQLRRTCGVSLATWKKYVKRPLSLEQKTFIATLVKNQLAQLTDTHLILTLQGMLVADTIISQLFEIE